MKKTIFTLASLFICLGASAETNQNALIQLVTVNGGTDTPNPGVSCIVLNQAVNQSCNAGYIAIPNNNKELLSAAIVANANKQAVHVEYYPTTVTQHCPGFATTDCLLNSIGLQAPAN